MSLPNIPDAPEYFGRSLTPESPRPLHIPEPANIPVLENQIDPIFNLMSTHMVPPFSARNMTAMDQQITELGSKSDVAVMVTEGDNQASLDKSMTDGEDIEVQGGVQAEDASVAAENNAAIQENSETSLYHDQDSSLTDQPSASLAPHDAPSPSNVNPQTNLPTQAPITEPTDSIDAHEPSQSSTQENENEQTAVPVENRESAQGDGEHEGGVDGPTGGGVNYQALLDNIVPPTTLADESSANAFIGNASIEDKSGTLTSPSSATLPSQNLAAAASLPPRPPPQEKPAIHPNYSAGEDIRSYHFPHIHNSNANNNNNSNSNQSTQAAQQSNSFRAPQSYQPAATGSNGLPPPPVASFQQSLRGSDDQVTSPTQGKGHNDLQGRRQNKGARNDDAPWAPEVQQLYDQFLDDEAIYTAEGTWDKFPQGSRLFVGNLPTEIVTKRDIFHIFYRYGRLAQISIKQAYGFVQFMDTSSSYEALRAEQNGKIKERNMHLEISKPPKNSRNAQPSAAGERLRAAHHRRSRSPNRRPGSRDVGRGGDRFNRNEGRDEPRRGRDDYRPRRSPSPRGFRGRDSYRGGRSPDRYVGGRDRSRSPYGRNRYDRGQSPHRRRSLDDDDNLPMRKRDARDVPEVQIIVMEDLDRGFIEYIEKQLQDAGLKVAVMQMPQNVSTDAVTKRQVLEGVQTIVRLFRSAQLTGRIPAQIFDRSRGGGVHFDNYDELELQTIVALINRNKSKQPPSVQQSPYGAVPPSFPTPMQQQQPPNLTNLLTSLDGPTLQKLVGALQNTPQTPQSVMSAALQSPTQNPDIAAILASAGQASQQNHPPGPGTQFGGFQAPQQQPQQQPFTSYNFPPPGQQHPQMHQQQQQPPMNQQYQYQPGGPQPQPHQVQDLMSQLAKYRQ